jgi:hypothetical protein
MEWTRHDARPGCYTWLVSLDQALELSRRTDLQPAIC